MVYDEGKWAVVPSSKCPETHISEEIDVYHITGLFPFHGNSDR